MGPVEGLGEEVGHLGSEVVVWELGEAGNGVEGLSGVVLEIGEGESCAEAVGNENGVGRWVLLLEVGEPVGELGISGIGKIRNGDGVTAGSEFLVEPRKPVFLAVAFNAVEDVEVGHGAVD